jgi:catechol 2,3-dioxygenase-like lactoylglutathione lyase family enzyme
MDCVAALAMTKQEKERQMRGTVHHIDLTVTDPEASFPLYDTFLTFLGYELYHRGDDGIEWTLTAGGGAHSVSLVPARGEHAGRGHDRYAPGLHHVAWWADSRGDVDRCHDRLLEIGATILDAPSEYPQYNKRRGYYALFFADRDGLKLELVWTPPAADAA